MQNIARKTKRSSPPNLKELLLLALERMMFPGVIMSYLLMLLPFIIHCSVLLQTEIFQVPVPQNIESTYSKYILFPMHLGKIKEVRI